MAERRALFERLTVLRDRTKGKKVGRAMVCGRAARAARVRHCLPPNNSLKEEPHHQGKSGQRTLGHGCTTSLNLDLYAPLPYVISNNNKNQTSVFYFFRHIFSAFLFLSMTSELIPSSVTLLFR